ncbi:late embryogenesis abundant protein 7-like [Nicotiana tomentosiformis]|uniref:late embryogenesis abundant protein 7-like n=1 Tax=Nicotiana tomentosiformis TaxID=4098 RepID=UPI00051B3FFA|nr:late embryogenesis abundant protein 7-like [Nicotiana tomentosiformis]
MASAQFNVDQSHDQAEAKTEQWVESANSTANSSVNKIEDAIQRARESAQQKREQNSGFLHQTGEQMMHMAQGTVDGVKNTLGIGSNKNK